MSGQASSSGQGTVAFGISLPLSGSSITSSQGDVLFHPDEPDSLLASRAIDVGQGSLSFRSQSGQQITSDQGSLTPRNLQPALIGQQVNSGQGTVTAGGNDVTVHISGVEMTSAPGTIVIGPVLLTGQSSSSASGTVVNSGDVPLVGIGRTLSAGTLIPNIEADDTFIASARGTASPASSLAITGIALTGSQGTMSTIDKQEALSGSSSTVGQGALVLTNSRVPTGQAVTPAMYPFGAPGYGDLTGSEVSLGQGYVEYPLSSASATITGEGVRIDQGHLVTTRHQRGGDDGGITLVRDRRKDEKTILEFIKNFVRNL